MGLDGAARDDADLSLLLWNGATAPVASDLDLGDARTSGSAAAVSARRARSDRRRPACT
jgi:hypothetical protein